MVVVKDCYFKARPGLISGIDIWQYVGEPVKFIGCQFHPEAVEVIEAFGSESGWDYEDCTFMGRA